MDARDRPRWWPRPRSHPPGARHRAGQPGLPRAGQLSKCKPWRDLLLERRFAARRAAGGPPKGRARQQIHGMRRPGAGLVETMWRLSLFLLAPAAPVQQRDNSNPCALRRSWADICIRTRQHRLVRVGAYSPGYGDSCAPWARRRFGCPPCLLSTSDAAHRARDLRGPACRLRRVLGPPGPNCCAVVIYLHTVVHRLWLTRQRTALLAITAAPRAEATSPDPMFGHAPDRPATPPDHLQ